MTKRYERAAEPQCRIYMDTFTGFSGEESLVAADLLCEIAATISSWALSRGYEVSIFAGASRLPSVSAVGAGRLGELRTALAYMEFDGKKMSDAPPAPSGEGYPVYVITARAEKIAESLKKAAAGCEVVCLHTDKLQMPIGGGIEEGYIPSPAEVPDVLGGVL